MRSAKAEGLSCKLLSYNKLRKQLKSSQSRGQKVVFTNGCFDLIHVGHVALLERAKKLGDVLVVATNSDRSVRALKGSSRPITAQRDRVRVLAGLESVDYVIVFDELTPQKLVEGLRPDILVKGADWSSDKIVGKDAVERSGGKVVRLPLIKGHSTSALIERIRTGKGA